MTALDLTFIIIAISWSIFSIKELIKIKILPFTEAFCDYYLDDDSFGKYLTVSIWALFVVLGVLVVIGSFLNKIVLF